MTAPSAGEGVGEGIYPETPQHAVPDPLPLTEFKSWHLPRKQWVRRHQWAETTSRLMEELALRDRPLRYLGLPGSDLLDLEVLAGICGSATTPFRYLGLNSAMQRPSEATMQRIADNTLRAIGNVDSGSLLLADDFAALASKKSIAFSRLRDFESFDVVNLDLCDAFTSAGGKPIHLAVQNVVEYQTNSRTQPWLLFVTTTVDRRVIAQAELQQYEALLTANANSSTDFGTELAGLIGNQGTPIAKAFSSAKGDQLARLLVLAMGKWLHGIVCGQPAWTIHLKSSVYYRWGLVSGTIATGAVAEGGLVSAVFGMVRNPIQAFDPTGIAGRSVATPVPDAAAREIRAALQMVKRVAMTVDLDCLLQADQNLREGLIRESAQMLAARNYSESKYLEFAGSVPTLQC